MAQLAAINQRIAELKAARVIALDIIPGAVPMEPTIPEAMPHAVRRGRSGVV